MHSFKLMINELCVKFEVAIRQLTILSTSKEGYEKSLVLLAIRLYEWLIQTVLGIEWLYTQLFLNSTQSIGTSNILTNRMNEAMRQYSYYYNYAYYVLEKCRLPQLV